MEHRIAINPDGTLEFIYSDEFRELVDSGSAKIERVSNVEPGTDGMWYADIRNGPKLGPFKYRHTALDAEIEYLYRELF